jgi:hypothetical protein
MSGPVRDCPSVSKALQAIPGVGPRLARSLAELGYREVEQLRGQDPEKMYQDLSRLRGAPVDRCVLYVFRCAVYYASNTAHDPALLKWWNWKNDRVEDKSILLFP